VDLHKALSQRQQHQRDPRDNGGVGDSEPERTSPPRRSFTHPAVVNCAVSVLTLFAGVDLTRDQASRLLRAWVYFPTLLPAEVDAVLRCFPTGAS
jgi:hypothetical protein